MATIPLMAFYDLDGRLHARAPIIKAGAFQYNASELPGYDRRDDPDRAVTVMRSLDEVRKAAPSFRGVPITLGHDGQTIGMIGATQFDAPYVYGDLVIWSPDALGRMRDLSPGYAFQLDWNGGLACDARQTNITPDHLALVETGRNGAEVSLRHINMQPPGPRYLQPAYSRKEMTPCRS